jgi:hypothetical protein
MTIGDQFQLSGCTLEEIVQAISDGEFEIGYLEDFAYRDELQECCLDAIEGLSSRQFAGPASNANVMGNAMEILRERYGVDAPRGWYPVMKTLRQISAEEQEFKQKSEQESKVQLEYERELLAWHAARKPLEDFHDQFEPSPEYEAVWRDMHVCHESLRTWAIWAVKSGELQNLERHRGFVP